MKLNTGKRIMEFSWADADTQWKETVAARWFEPILEWAVRTGEIMLLAGAFQLAAKASHYLTLAVCSSVMIFVLGLHFGMTWARVSFPLHGVKIKGWPQKIGASVFALAFGLLQAYLWWQIYQAVQDLALPS